MSRRTRAVAILGHRPTSLATLAEILAPAYSDFIESYNPGFGLDHVVSEGEAPLINPKRSDDCELELNPAHCAPIDGPFESLFDDVPRRRWRWALDRAKTRTSWRPGLPPLTRPYLRYEHRRAQSIFSHILGPQPLWPDVWTGQIRYKPRQRYIAEYRPVNYMAEYKCKEVGFDVGFKPDPKMPNGRCKCAARTPAECTCA
jgi:hypothetical protein